MESFLPIVFDLEQEFLEKKEVAYNKYNQKRKCYSNILSDSSWWLNMYIQNFRCEL